MTRDHLPAFVPSPQIAISGRMMSSFGHTSAVPVVLSAYYLPGRGGLGSAVYAIAAVGPSDGTWPFFPIGGYLVGSESLQILQAVDETSYSMEEAGTVDLDPFGDFRFDVCDAETLLSESIPLVAEALQLTPWNDELAEPWVEACDGWDHFDEFMAIGVHDFDQSQR
ncbi:MAG: hypothetical protein AB7Q27_04635 [Acidimicrobiia bacterium]